MSIKEVKSYLKGIQKDPGKSEQGHSVSVTDKHNKPAHRGGHASNPHFRAAMGKKKA
jgi:hypothetical protein